VKGQYHQSAKIFTHKANNEQETRTWLQTCAFRKSRWLL